MPSPNRESLIPVSNSRAERQLLVQVVQSLINDLEYRSQCAIVFDLIQGLSYVFKYMCNEILSLPVKTGLRQWQTGRPIRSSTNSVN
jgi:hypothetical protein